MYKGIIFDLDGVICFTDQYHYQAWKKLADERSIPFDEEINKRLRGVIPRLTGPTPTRRRSRWRRRRTTPTGNFWGR